MTEAAAAIHGDRHAPGGADDLSSYYASLDGSGNIPANQLGNADSGLINDTMANRPTAASYKGWYFAKDINGGTLYYSDGSAWTKVDAGVAWASGQQLAYAQDTNLNFSASAVGTTQTDLASGVLQIAVPASAVPVLVHGKVLGEMGSGSNTAGGVNTAMRLYLTDSANNMYDTDILSLFTTGITNANETLWQSFYVATILPAPVTATTFKLRGNMMATPPSGFGGAIFVGGVGYPTAWIEAVAR